MTEHTRATRQRIIDAAVQVANSDNPFSYRNIARVAGLSRDTVKAYFTIPLLKETVLSVNTGHNQPLSDTKRQSQKE